MNKSAFAHEQEIILTDGTDFEVIGIEKSTNDRGQPMSIIKLRNAHFKYEEFNLNW